MIRDFRIYKLFAIFVTFLKEFIKSVAKGHDFEMRACLMLISVDVNFFLNQTKASVGGSVPSNGHSLHLEKV